MTNGDVIGGSLGATAPLGKRIISDVVDLILVPILLGILAGVLLFAVQDPLRTIFLAAINISWLFVRDFLFSPGRKLVGLKLVSISGEKVTAVQAILRNILLMIPLILVAGYIVELLFVLIKGHRLGDTWAKTKVTV